jgi:hypothetical protein
MPWSRLHACAAAHPHLEAILTALSAPRIARLRTALSLFTSPVRVAYATAYLENRAALSPGTDSDRGVSAAAAATTLRAHALAFIACLAQAPPRTDHPQEPARRDLVIAQIRRAPTITGHPRPARGSHPSASCTRQPRCRIHSHRGLPHRYPTPFTQPAFLPHAHDPRPPARTRRLRVPSPTLSRARHPNSRQVARPASLLPRPPPLTCSPARPAQTAGHPLQLATLTPLTPSLPERPSGP